MKAVSFIAAFAAIVIGIMGPRWAINLNYTQASEKNMRIVNTANSVHNNTNSKNEVVISNPK
jgi:hypothetical protein